MSGSPPVSADLPLVAFDDTGNTGQELLDADQPVFVLASVRIDDVTAGQLAAHARGPRFAEAKFVDLKRRESSRRRVLDVLRSNAIGPETVRFAVFHKAFLTTTYMVDLLVEPLAHATHFNLYESRANLAVANLLHAVTDSFCGAGSLAGLQSRFVAVARAKTDGEAARAVRDFYAYVRALRVRNAEPRFDDPLGMLEATEVVAPAWVGQCDPVAIDPAVPAFADLAAQWTAALRTPFAIAHDRSKPIEHEREVLEQLMRDQGETRVFAEEGAIARAWPVLATGIQFVDSRDVPQVQIADLLAGAAATLMNVRAGIGSADDAFVQALLGTRLDTITFDPIWPPSRDALLNPRTDGGGTASAAIDYVGSLVQNPFRRRR